MKKIFLTFSSLLISCFSYSQQTSNSSETAPGSSSKTYQPPTFLDPDRIAKIKAAIPALEKIYREYAEKNNYPGMAFGVVVDDKVIFSGGYGYTDLANKTKASGKSLFRIASMSKSVTTMAILKLRDEGKLRLDDPAYLYIPELKSMPLLTTDSPAITIRNLMTHAAGFPEDNPWGDRQLDGKDEELLDLIKSGISNSNVPGVQYEYSNLAFAILGKIIGNITKIPYQQYINENIFKPLGMVHTIWEYSKAPADLLAHGYRWEEGKWKEEVLLHDGTYGAMGGILTSIDDFGKYMAFHLSAWPARNDKETGPVKRSSVREMQQPWTFNNLNAKFKYPNGRECSLVSSYGYGLRTSRDCQDRIFTGHTGGLPGFGSQWWIMPEYGIGVIANGNLTYASMNTANFAVMDTLISLAGLKPRELPVSPILKLRKDQIVKLLPNWSNAETNNIFAVNFFPDRSVELRKKASLALFDKIGKVKKVTELKPQNQLRGNFQIEGEHGAIDVYFTLTPENPALIQQLDIKEIPK
ncbi:serine hydrolase [Dyadobacter sp. CY356]|uniref:serine hydrolase domain-containing protein n=1 Tax=Dyadobacter sp. CY356 TaxID=2906442 RepID=UPI001F32BCD1|nr:serine hydrolase domain-containing protein [Dyadobacter sp. CY356]MCF0055673.1 beta-lactamase family protein [Dyadobacter sp. CY356]